MVEIAQAKVDEAVRGLPVTQTTFRRLAAPPLTLPRQILSLR